MTTPIHQSLSRFFTFLIAFHFVEKCQAEISLLIISIFTIFDFHYRANARAPWPALRQAGYHAFFRRLHLRAEQSSAAARPNARRLSILVDIYRRLAA